MANVSNEYDDNLDAFKARRAAALAAARVATAEYLNAEYGTEGLPNRLTPESIEEDSIPVTTDCIAFLIWLRKNTDFFSGPDLNISFPKEDTPEFIEVAAQLAVIYTGAG